MDVLLVANQFIVGEELLHLVGHQQARRSSADIDDANSAALRVVLIRDAVGLAFHVRHGELKFRSFRSVVRGREWEGSFGLPVLYG